MTTLNRLASALEALEAARLSVGGALDRLALEPATWAVSAASYINHSPDRFSMQMRTIEEARRVAVVLGLEGPTIQTVRAVKGRPGYKRHEWSDTVAGVRVDVWSTDTRP